MPKKVDLIPGSVYAELTLIEEGKLHITSGGHKHRTIVCRCNCQKIVTVQMSSVFNGKIKSCGCLSARMASERIKTRNTIHALSKRPEYNVWLSMKKRCLNPKNKAYNYYGGRGIQICERWLKSFTSFYADMGSRPTPNHSLDRIDCNGNYEPSNCRWATNKEQSRNQRNNVLVEYNGEIRCLAEWAEIYELKWETIHYRIFIAKWPQAKWFVSV